MWNWIRYHLFESKNSDNLTKKQVAWIHKALDGNKKVIAIKCCREFTGLGLKEAKGIVDRMMEER